MAQLTLSPPWFLHYRKIEAMFKNDPGVHVILDDTDEKRIKVYVDDTTKALAIQYLLNPVVEMGSVKVFVDVIFPNHTDYHAYSAVQATDIQDLFRTAFIMNRAFRYATRLDGVFSNPIYYVVFEKTVVQYFTDDIGDIHGICSTLYQDLAADIFNHIDGVQYCTDIDDFKGGRLRQPVTPICEPCSDMY